MIKIQSCLLHIQRFFWTVGDSFYRPLSFSQSRKNSQASPLFQLSIMRIPVLVFATALSTAIANAVPQASSDSSELGYADDPNGESSEGEGFQYPTSNSLIDSDEVTNGPSCGTPVSDQTDLDQIGSDQINSDRIDARSELTDFELIDSAVAPSNKKTTHDARNHPSGIDCGMRRLLCCFWGVKNRIGKLCFPCMNPSSFSFFIIQKIHPSISLSI